MLKAATAAIRKGDKPAIDNEFVDALGDVADNDALEPAFRAQALQLPSEADLAHEIGEDIDPQAIASARRALRARIAERIGDRLGRLTDRRRRPARRSRPMPLRPAAARLPTPRLT